MDHASELQVASDVPAAMTQPAAAEVTAAAVPKSVERRRNWFELLAAPAIALPLLTAMGLLLYFVNLGGYPLYTKGEPREAVTVVNMMAGGGVILPLRAGIEVPSKPLLMHWLAALLSLYAGHVDEWTVRLPSAIFSLLGLLCCYWYVRRLFDQTAALISALVLGTTIQYLQAGTGARVDMTLSFFLEIAFFEFLLVAEGLTKRRMLFYAAVSCAALAKGPIGIVLPAAVAGIWILLERRWDIVGDIKIARGAALIAMMVGGWYVAATIEGGSGFLRKQILRENIFTFFYDPNLSGGHSHPFYYVELALLAGFLPWSTLLPFAAAEGLPKIKRINPRTAYLLVWLATVLLFYSMAHSKRGVYLLA